MICYFCGGATASEADSLPAVCADGLWSFSVKEREDRETTTNRVCVCDEQYGLEPMHVLHLLLSAEGMQRRAFVQSH